MNDKLELVKPRNRLAPHWADLPAILPAAALQAGALGLVAGMASGGLVGWLLFDRFWIGTLAVAIPLSLIFLLLFLRTGLIDNDQGPDEP
ncbi:MAG: hypothetical protein JWQ90_1989 [Hydrocarboniphaga sp.]|uniref:hypothetical protein n=1 Tax=Hydrocarboniphaga sp. TaxID=2033016 RepID=UPI0026259E90|nr:hypothetical protein [Hydrocarboniphaga sp.]MDB5969539.1 hypothetical protein [Hydrocarboniphaga sp.]